MKRILILLSVLFYFPLIMNGQIDPTTSLKPGSQSNAQILVTDTTASSTKKGQFKYTKLSDEVTRIINSNNSLAPVITSSGFPTTAPTKLGTRFFNLTTGGKYVYVGNNIWELANLIESINAPKKTETYNTQTYYNYTGQWYDINNAATLKYSDADEAWILPAEASVYTYNAVPKPYTYYSSTTGARKINEFTDYITKQKYIGNILDSTYRATSPAYVITPPSLSDDTIINGLGARIINTTAPRIYNGIIYNWSKAAQSWTTDDIGDIQKTQLTSIVQNSLVDTLYDYTALRNYTGKSNTIIIKKAGIAGTFVKDVSVTSDDGGINIFGNSIGWKRQGVTDIGYADWYEMVKGNSTVTQQVYNYTCIMNMQKLGLIVQLGEGTYKIQSTYSGTTHTNNNIVRGIDSIKTKVVLMNTMRYGVDTTWGYVNSLIGNNTLWENMWISTNNYENGTYGDATGQYIISACFYTSSQSAKPKMIYNIFRNCKITGNVTIAIRGNRANCSSDDEYLALSAGEIALYNCSTDRNSVVIAVDNIKYDVLKMKDTRLRNIYAPTMTRSNSVASPQSRDCGQVFLENVDLRNEAPIANNQTYLNIATVKTDAEGFVKNCKINGLWTTNLNTEVAPYYITTSKQIIDENSVYEHLYGNSATERCVIRGKESKKMRFINVTWFNDVTDFVKGGAMTSTTQALSTIDKTNLISRLFFLNPTGTVKDSKFEFINCNISDPYINYSSDLRTTQNFVLDKNTKIKIGYVANPKLALYSSSSVTPSAIFADYYVSSGASPDTSGTCNFLNEADWTIGGSDSSEIRVYSLGAIEPLTSGTIDTVIDYDIWRERGTYTIPKDVMVTFTPQQARVGDFSPTVIGGGYGIKQTSLYNPTKGTICQRLVGNAYLSKLYVNKSAWNNALFLYNPAQTSTTSIQSVETDTINICRGYLYDALYYCKDSLPMFANIYVDGILTTGDKFSVEYKIGLANSYRGHKFMQENGSIIDLTADSNVSDTTYIKPSVPTPFRLALIRNAVSTMYTTQGWRWTLSKTNTVRSINIRFTTKYNYNVNNSATGTTTDATVSVVDKSGTATLVTGTVTINNTSITATTKIRVYHKTAAGVVGVLSTTRVNGTSFTIVSSSSADTSDVEWEIVN